MEVCLDGQKSASVYMVELLTSQKVFQIAIGDSCDVKSISLADGSIKVV